MNEEITKLLNKGAIIPVIFSPTGFYSRMFLVPKKGGSFRPVIDLSQLNKFVVNEHFQMENLLCAKQIINPQDFMVKLDLKDAYLTVGVHPNSQKYLRFIWQGQVYQFQALPFGLNTAPRVFTKLLRPVVAFLRTRNIRLLIYLDDILLVASSPLILRQHTNIVINLLQDLGFIINFEKSILTPTQILEFLGFIINAVTMKFYLPPEKITKTSRLCKSLMKENPTSLHLLSQLLGFLESCRPAVWLAPLHFRHLQSCLIEQVALNNGGYHGTVHLSRPALGELQWWILNIHQVHGSPIRPPSSEMIITSDASKMGWGATCGNIFNQRTLVTQGESPSHKCPRTEGSISCHTIIPETPIKPSSETSPRQYDSGLIHQQPGRNPLSKVNVSDSRAVELVSTTQYISEGGIPSGCPERPSGQRIEGVHRLERLENTIGGYTAFSQGQGNRPVCHQIDESTATLCKLAPRSPRLRNRRVYSGLEYHEGICISPIQSDSSNTNESERRQCNSTFSSTNLASTTLVAPVTTAGNKPTSSSSIVSNSPGESVQSRGHSSNVSKTPASRLGHLQQRCSAEGFPGTVTRLLSSATRQSTNKAYDSAWGKWSSWCDTRQTDPISANIRDILVFLSDQFDNKLQYRTINVLRSAISSVHPWIDGKPVGQHPLVIRLMKGIANERPSKPRYSSTWDVSRVTSYLSSLGDNDKLCLKLLTKKLLMLLALISPERSSVLSDLDIQFLKKQPDGFTFTLTKPRKTGDPRSLTTIAFPCFKEDSTLCPLKCLESYLNATSEFRTLPECKKLFLSTLRPHRPVSKSTIARWLCDTITASGIDSTIFKAHSTRAASTSTAAKKQLPLNDILKMGDWTSSSTFQRFYYKPTIDDSYAKTILKS